MKSVIEWFILLPNDYRELALKSLRRIDDILLYKVDSMHKAIANGLTWDMTPEGYSFWYDVYMHFTSNNKLPSLPKK